MGDTAHEEYVLDKAGQAWRIAIKYDDDHSIGDVLNDEPCIVYTVGSYGQFCLHTDQSKALIWNGDYYKVLTGDDIEEAVIQMLQDEYDPDGDDDYSDEQRAEATIKVNLLRARIKRKDYHSHAYQGDGYVVIWDQDEMDAYCGTPGQTPGESLQHYLDGEVYGYIVDPVSWVTNPEDLCDEGEPIVHEHQEDSESCWGFIGEESYCLGEARDVVDTVHTFATLQGLLDFIEGDDAP